MGTNTRTETYAPLIYCVIVHALLQATSYIRCFSLGPINVVNFRLVNFRLRGSTLLWLKVTHSFSAGAPPWILLGELMTPPGFLISWRALFSFFPSRRLRHFVGTSVDENLSRTTSHFRGCTACNAKSNVHFTFIYLFKSYVLKFSLLTSFSLPFSELSLVRLALNLVD